VASGEKEEDMNSEQKLKSYKDLLVWQKGMTLVKDIYRLTSGFPQDERFGLMSQLRRAAVSVPSNIAEGQSRHTSGEFIQFLSHAEGSLAELETQILIAVDLDFCGRQAANQALVQIEELQRMLNSLRQKLATRH
jgi:four helix bundle protein